MKRKRRERLALGNVLIMAQRLTVCSLKRSYRQRRPARGLQREQGGIGMEKIDPPTPRLDYVLFLGRVMRYSCSVCFRGTLNHPLAVVVKGQGGSRTTEEGGGESWYRGRESKVTFEEWLPATNHQISHLLGGGFFFIPRSLSEPAAPGRIKAPRCPKPPVRFQNTLEAVVDTYNKALAERTCKTMVNSRQGGWISSAQKFSNSATAVISAFVAKLT